MTLREKKGSSPSFLYKRYYETHHSLRTYGFSQTPGPERQGFAVAEEKVARRATRPAVQDTATMFFFFSFTSPPAQWDGNNESKR